MLYLDYSRASPASGSRTASAAARTSTPSSSCGPATTRSTGRYPGTITIAEESTSWPGRDRPDRRGRARLRLQVGPRLDARHARLPRTRTPSTGRWHHDQLTFRSLYATSASTSSFRSPMTRSCTARGRCYDQMPATTGSASRTSDCSFGFQLAPARQEAALHGRRVRPASRVGPTVRAIDWHLLDDAGAPRCSQRSWRELNAPLPRQRRRCTATTSPTRAFAWIDGERPRPRASLCIERHDETGHAPRHRPATRRPSRRERYLVGHAGIPGAWSLLLHSDDGRFGGSGYAVPDGRRGSEASPGMDGPSSAAASSSRRSGLSIYGRRGD